MTELTELLQTLIAEALNDAEDTQEAESLLRAIDGTDAQSIETALTLARLIGEAGEAEAAIKIVNAAEMNSADATIVALIVYCFALLRVEFAARKDAVSARQQLTEFADTAYETIGNASVDALDFTIRMVGQTVVSISQITATLAPVIGVEIGIPVPASLIAYDLYSDASRAEELVNRNKHSTPMLMPTKFEAVAS